MYMHRCVFLVMGCLRKNRAIPACTRLLLVSRPRDLPDLFRQCQEVLFLPLPVATRMD